MGDGFCDNLLNYGSVPVLSPERIGAVMIVLGVLYLIMSVLIIYFIKIQERYAQSGDDKAVQSVIFPVFVNTLWLNAMVNVYVGIVALAFNFNPFQNTDKAAIWAFAIMWALQHMVVEGVAVLLMQKGLGMNAAVRTFKIIFVWGLITLFVQWAVYNAQRVPAFVLNVLWNAVLVVFYLVLWLTPRKYLYRRPAAMLYAKFWTFFRSIALLATIFFFAKETQHFANCVYTFGSLFPFALFEPLIMYYVLLLDSRWWQGLDIGKYSSSESGEEIKSPLRGMDLDLKSAQTLAESMDTLGISSSRSKPKAVKLLNFAYISLDKSKLLGSGSFSKVYLGKYRKRPCAIKLIFTIDVTQEIISRIAAEAQILSTIKHPNVVEILGVSVLPPSVCILLELCAFGSLNDVIGGTGFAALGTIPDFVRHFLRGSSIIGKYSNRGLNISWKDRLYLAIGCARGLAALHALKPEVCHRDVKSMNFLVDENLNAKISDLELGITDDLLISSSMKKSASSFVRRPASSSSRSNRSGSNGSNSVNSVSKGSVKSQDSANSVASPTAGTIRPLSVESSRSSKVDDDVDSIQSLSSIERGDKTVLHGDDFLANWAAPEVIRDAYHSQASDIYSFGLVLWELLVGTVPFSDVKRQDDIRERVLDGLRPDIPPCFLNPPYEEFFITFTDLMKRCWSPEPLLRPTIHHVLDKLELLYRQQCYQILYETSAIERVINDMNTDSIIKRPSLRSFFRSKYSNFNLSNLQAITRYLQEEDTPRGIGSNIANSNHRNSNNINADSLRNVLEEFNDTNEAWCLCLPDHQFTIVWGSDGLEESLCLPVKEMIGKSFMNLSCFEIKDEERSFYSTLFQRSTRSNQKQEKINTFFEKLREMKVGYEKHFVLELIINRFRTFSTLSADSTGTTGTGTGRSNVDVTGLKVITASSLYSLHCYPIATLPLVTSNIAINSNNPSNDYQYHEFSHTNSIANSPMLSSSLKR